MRKKSLRKLFGNPAVRRPPFSHPPRHSSTRWFQRNVNKQRRRGK